MQKVDQGVPENHEEVLVSHHPVPPLGIGLQGLSLVGPWILPGLATNSIFFCLLFLKKIIDLPGGQINDPSSGKHYSLPFLPAPHSSPSWTLEGLFEQTVHPSRALDSLCALLSKLLRIKNTVRYGS